MLKMHVNEFLDYCKVAGFSPRSRASLVATLREFATYLETIPVESPKDITYGQLSDFIADFREPSVQKGGQVRF